MGLTGITILNPHFSLVVVEGSAKAIKTYNRLMLARILWTEPAAARSTVLGDEDAADEEPQEGEESSVTQQQNNAPEEPTMDSEVSLADNRCDKIWEGPLRDRAFKSFKAKSCPTDTLAKDALGVKWIGQWDLAKNFVPEDEL
jgi:U4/U6 small nuclear ribonucleoprotein PRP3